MGQVIRNGEFEMKDLVWVLEEYQEEWERNLRICQNVRSKNEYYEKRIGIDKCLRIQDKPKLWWIRNDRQQERDENELKKGRSVRGKKTLMRVDDELNSCRKNGWKVLEKVMNAIQRDELVAMLECLKGRAKKTVEKDKISDNARRCGKRDKEDGWEST